MVKAGDIRDRDTLERWLEKESSQAAFAVSCRAAARVLPPYFQSDDGVEELRQRGVTTILILRALITTISAASPPGPDLTHAARSTAVMRLSFSIDVYKARPTLASRAASAALAAAASVYDPMPAGDAAHAAALANEVVGEFFTGEGEILEQVCEDARMVDAGQSPLQSPLWSIPHPAWFRQADAEMRARWISDPSFSFWLRWWDGVVSGKQLDWALQEKVALIPSEVWEQGAAAVAERIALIEEQMRLLREAERLKAELAAARSEIAAFSTRSHNNPPELVEPAAEIERQAGEIAQALEVVAREFKSDAPRPAVLRRVGAALLVAAGKSLSYCASLADAAFRKAAEEAGSLGAKALIGAGLLAWMSQLEAVKALARAMEAFAKLLGG